ncbi:MAG: hypothetical protein M3217_06355 [Actinomycetota bacterium]|nr:hypothetical protein [Actinomycetota bacterium]
MRRLRTLLAGTVLAFAIVPALGTPAQACFSVECIVNCVENVANGHLICRA